MTRNMHDNKVDTSTRFTNLKSVDNFKLGNSTDDAEIQSRIRQIQECTDCTIQKALSALQDCDSDVHRAIEYLLDKNSDANDWQTTRRKSAKPKRILSESINISKNVANDISEVELDIHPRVSGPHVETCHTLNERGISPYFDQTTKRKSGKQIPISEQRSKHRSSETADSIEMNDYLSSEECNDNWDHGDWKGEAIVIVNSNSFPVNINEDIELLKLATTQPEVKIVDESIPYEVAEEEPYIPQEPQRPLTPVQEIPQNISTDAAESARSQIFARFAKSLPPKASVIPDVAVFFAPGANAASKYVTNYSFDVQSVKTGDVPKSDIIGYDAKEQQPVKSKSARHQEKKAKSKSTHFDKNTDEIREYPSNQCENSPEINFMFQATPNLPPLMESPSDRSYASVLHNDASMNDPYAHLQGRETTPNRANANPFIPSNSFNNYMLDEISQNIGKVALNNHINKADAFTQSISSNHLDTSPQYHSLQSTKQTAPQNQLGKLGQPIQSNTSQPSLPSTQAHPHLNPYMPQLISQLHSSFPMFNMHGGSSASQQLLELEQLQALQHQRFLFEMQQQQLNSTESSLPNTCSDVMSSSKASAPLNHVAATNAGLRPDLLASALGHHQMLGQAAAAPFLSYPSIFLMNGYPNAFLSQQQVTQPNVSQTQNSGHGGSALTQNQSSQQQYIKGMNSTANYQGYQGLRQSNFDELGDVSFPNMSKVGYKHNNQQAMYSSQPNQQNCEMSLSAKLQQNAACQQNLVGSQQQSASHYANSGSPANQYSPYLHQQYLAAMSALVAQQNSASNAGPGNLSLGAQMQGNSIGSGLHGQPVMVMGAQGSSMHHQRAGASQH